MAGLKSTIARGIGIAVRIDFQEALRLSGAQRQFIREKPLADRTQLVFCGDIRESFFDFQYQPSAAIAGALSSRMARS
ncbi:hypothetical protein LCI23_05170 [Massilia sp. MS-15]|nr:hypothetical protein [Massilia sp. MS-15]